MTAHNDILFIRENLGREFGRVTGNLETVRDQLADRINQLIVSDFPRLVNILYRLDVSEAGLKEALLENPAKNAGELIADRVIERLLKKLKSRAQFRPNSDIPDDEKW